MFTSEPDERNPLRVAAGKTNRQKRGPLTPEGKRRLRDAALHHQPWQYSTGPKTAAGKARAGKVELKAFHEAGNIVIEIIDDGRGLNKKKLLEKATAAGIISPGQELARRSPLAQGGRRDGPDAW